MLRWKLKEIMAKHNITNNALAKELEMRPASISYWRNAKTIPSIGGDRLVRLCEALSKLAGTKINFSELYEEEAVSA